MQRNPQDLATTSSNELTEYLAANNRKFQASCADVFLAFRDSVETMKASAKKSEQEKYLKSNTMNYKNQISQIHSDADTLIKLIESEQDDQKTNQAINDFTNKWPAFIVLLDQRIEIKKTSLLTYYLARNDIEKAFINVKFEDLFNDLSFARTVEIPASKVTMPVEDNFLKIDKRINDAKREQLAINKNKQEDYKNALSYKAFTFFTRHPIASTAILALGSAAVGITSGLAVSHLIETMGYKK